jgi:hypothetical protein
VARRDQRDIDWGDGVRRSGLFDVGEKLVLAWVRQVSIDDWLIDERSKSYIVALSEPDRRSLLRTVERLVRARFPDGNMRVRYETWLWIANRI